MDDWLWPGAWERQNGAWKVTGWINDKGAGKFFREDCADAGIVIGRKGAEALGGRVIDIHSLRHSFGVSLRGLDKQLQMRLLRTDSEAIWRTYAHPDDIEDLQERIEAMNKRQSPKRSP